MALKTPGEIITDLFRIVKASPAIMTITPNVFKKERPLNFEGECIVINSLPITTSQIQEGVINLNYFVPNLVNTATSPVDRSQPNNSRLDAGETIIAEQLRKIWGMNGHAFWIAQITQFSNDNFHEWYSNFRIQYINGNN